MRFQYRQILMLLLMVLAVACSSVKPFVISGESLDAIGKQFVTVGNLYNSMLSTQQITPEQYRPWATFAKKFQQTYPSSVAAWKKARIANDQIAENKVSEAITLLTAQLQEFALLALRFKEGNI